MKIQYMSDLHLEFATMPIPDVAGEVLVLAGDIHLGDNAIAWIAECASVFKDVIYILGNHEYYNQDYWKLADKIKDSIAGKNGLFDPLLNVHFLDNTSIKIGDVNFHGTTLWSKANPMLSYMMNDFKKITYKHAFGYGKLTPEEASALHSKAKWWLMDNIVSDEKNVIISHHAPSYEMINLERYGDDGVVNTGYATEILQEFNANEISLWISGHTHNVCDKMIADIHSVSNCRGYVPYEANPNFNPTAIVEV